MAAIEPLFPIINNSNHEMLIAICEYLILKQYEFEEIKFEDLKGRKEKHLFTVYIKDPHTDYKHFFHVTQRPYRAARQNPEDGPYYEQPKNTNEKTELRPGGIYGYVEDRCVDLTYLTIDEVFTAIDKYYNEICERIN
jgi:hypothetical protein